MLLLAIAAGLLAAALLVLALPIELRFQVRGIDPLQGQLDVRALFGLWQKHLAAPTPRQDGRAANARTGAAAARKPAGRRRDGLARLRALGRDAGLRHKALSRLRAALATLRWSGLRLRLRLGLDDPADTGCLWAVIGPLGAELSGLRAADIAIEPDFGGPTLDFDARAHLVFLPLRLLWSLAGLAAIFGLALARQRCGRKPLIT